MNGVKVGDRCWIFRAEGAATRNIGKQLRVVVELTPALWGVEALEPCWGFDGNAFKQFPAGTKAQIDKAFVKPLRDPDADLREHDAELDLLRRVREGLSA